MGRFDGLARPRQSAGPAILTTLSAQPRLVLCGLHAALRPEAQRRGVHPDGDVCSGSPRSSRLDRAGTYPDNASATFPLAPGENGQPPKPPAELSKMFHPAVKAA